MEIAVAVETEVAVAIPVVGIKAVLTMDAGMGVAEETNVQLEI